MFASVADDHTKAVLATIKVRPRDRHIDTGRCYVSDEGWCHCCRLGAEPGECWWCCKDRVANGTRSEAGHVS